MKSTAILLIALVAFSSLARGQVGAPFSLINTKRTVVSGQTSLYQNVCSQVMYVASYHAGRQSSPPTYLPITYSSTGGLGVYSDSACSVSTTTGQINPWDNDTGFWIMSAAAGTSTVTATANNYFTRSYTVTTAGSNSFVWTGGAGTNVWTTPANWSGNAVPGSSDVAYFDSTCTYCLPQMTSNPNIDGIVIASTFPGTLTQKAGVPVTLGQRGLRQNGGVLTSTSDAFTINGPFDLSGGTFTASSGTLTVNGSPFNVRNGAVFNANNGTVWLGLQYGTLNVI